LVLSSQCAEWMDGWIATSNGIILMTPWQLYDSNRDILHNGIKFGIQNRKMESKSASPRGSCDGFVTFPPLMLALGLIARNNAAHYRDCYKCTPSLFGLLCANQSRCFAAGTAL
jgi:hypothetical protein